MHVRARAYASLLFRALKLMIALYDMTGLQTCSAPVNFCFRVCHKFGVHLLTFQQAFPCADLDAFRLLAHLHVQRLIERTEL